MEPETASMEAIASGAVRGPSSAAALLLSPRETLVALMALVALAPRVANQIFTPGLWVA